MMILDLLGISFHAVVVFALGKNLVFKFALGHCDCGTYGVVSHFPKLLIIYRLYFRAYFGLSTKPRPNGYFNKYSSI